MKIAVSGGTGFIGRPLVAHLQKAGHHVLVLTRDVAAATKKDPSVTYVSWDEVDDAVHGSDALINLAGENLFGKRWTTEVKKSILESRVDATVSLVQSMQRAEEGRRPSVFLSTSAVGYYGDADNRLLTEESPPGDDFLAYVCVRWEEEAQKAPADVRVVNPRMGIVLHPEGGALEQMLLPFKLFVGGAIGSGDQYFPWIVRRDVVLIFEFLLKNTAIRGPVNIVAPESATMSEFARALGTALSRPSLFKVPEFALSFALGGEAASAVTASQRAVPNVLQEAGFEWEFPKLQEALNALFR